MCKEYKYISLLEKGYDEYSLSMKIHKKLFPLRKFKYGMIKYRYYVKDEHLEIEHWYTPLILLWMALMFIPSVIMIGFPETLYQIKDIFKYTFKLPLTSDYVARKCYNGKLNSTYEEFMKYATLKKKGKENV